MQNELLMVFWSIGYVVVMAVLAYGGKMFWPSQMQMKGHPKGFPFVANGTVWGMFIFGSIIFYITTPYVLECTLYARIVVSLVGIFVGILLFYCFYRQGKFPDSLAGAGVLHPAGFVAALYFGTLMEFVALFYLRTSHPKTEDVLWVWFLLGMFIFMANHIPLHYIRKYTYMPWCPNVLAEESRPLLLFAGQELLVAMISIVKLL
jgi:hypothetical protein